MAPVLALSGFMGSGKSAVGRMVAERLGRRFFDLDTEVEDAAGVRIGDLFSDRGEAGFREIECSALRDVLRRAGACERGAVLALGGGTVTWPASAQLLAGRATVVLLTGTTAEQWARAVGTDRPLARSADSFGRLAEERRGVYLRTADIVVDTAGLGLEEAAAAVIAAVGSSAREMTEVTGHTGETWCIDVAAPSRRTHIVGGPGALSALEERSILVAEAGLRVFVVTDANVMRLHGSRLAALTSEAVPEDGVLVVGAGESSKDGATAMRCWDWLASSGVRRDDIVLAFGGGVVGDLAGFVAATYLRGVRLWQVPTTLLAQVDSSVGGKVAINLAAGKNLVGAFYQPELVVADQALLSTLRGEDFASGLGEVVKYALLVGDDLFSELEERAESLAARRSDLLSGVVARCVGFKAEVVREDETDRGRRAVLNLGHTVGHALETVLGFGAISHGAAVGLGLLAALAVSEVVTGLPHGVRERTGTLLRVFGLPTAIVGLDPERMLGAMLYDKKMTADGLSFVCLQDLGRPAWGVSVDEATLRAGIEVIRS